MVMIRLVKLCWRELCVLVGDPRLLVIILLTPVLYTVLFGYLYLPKRVSEIPLWVIDEDHSALSRAITVAAANSETFHLARIGGSVTSFQRATQQGVAFACLVIPEHFEREVKEGKSVRLLTLIDGSNMIIANSVLRGATELSATYSVGIQIKRLSLRGTPSMYAQSAAMPVESPSHVWYNPTFNYMDFLLPGLIGTIIQQVTLLGVALAFTREREQKLLGTALRISRSPLELLMAKGITYTLLNLAVAGLSYYLAIRFFGIHFSGSISAFIILLAVFIAALVAMGLVVSVLAKDQLFATQILMLIAVPSFLVSGFTWPQMSMIKGIYTISNLLPLTHFVLPLRTLCMQNGDLSLISVHLLWLWVFMILCYLLAYPMIAHNMRIALTDNPDYA